MENLDTIAALLTTSSFLPQAIKTIKSKDTDGLSLGMYFFFTIGVLCWAIYGVYIKEPAIFLANIITFCLACVILFYIVRNTINSKK